MTRQIAFVGGGNMATGLIGGLVARGTPPSSIVVADPEASQRSRLEHDYGVMTVADAPAAVVGARTVVLAVKPQQMAQVARSIADPVAAAAALVISVAAGIRLQDLARWLGPGVPLIRTMPNRPALIGAGITALYALPGVDAASRQTAETILAACGPTVWVPDESQLDVVTAPGARLAGAGRPGRTARVDALVVVVDGDRQHLLGAVLADHVFVEDALDLVRLRQLLASLLGLFLEFLANDVVAQLDAFVADEHRGARNELAHFVLALAAEGAVEELAVVVLAA